MMESNLDRLEGRTEGFRLLFMRDGGVRHGSITISETPDSEAQTADMIGEFMLNGRCLHHLRCYIGATRAWRACRVAFAPVTPGTPRDLGKYGPIVMSLAV